MYRFGSFRGLIGITALTVCLVTACSEGNTTVVEPLPSPTEVATDVVLPEMETVEPAPAVPPGIVIESQTRTDLSQYSEFMYDTASTVGLEPAAAELADSLLAALVDPWVEEAAAENETQDCLAGESKCGYFSSTLDLLKCSDGLLCVKSNVDKSGIGMATGFANIEVIRIDPESGTSISLREYLGDEGTRIFLNALNKSAELIQRVNGAYFADESPNYSLLSIPSWLPLSDGIHIWFPKYELGPGYLGVVEVRLQQSDQKWESWVFEESGELAVLSVSNEGQTNSREPGVTNADRTTLARILSDISWDLDSLACRNVQLSNRDSNWGILDQSRDAPDNPAGCFLADSFQYVGKINGKWRILDYPGSSVDYCSSIREGLEAEGVSSIAIKDFSKGRECRSGVEEDDQQELFVTPDEENWVIEPEPEPETVDSSVECAQVNGLYRCVGNYPDMCLSSMERTADIAVAYRAGLYPVGVNGQLAKYLAQVEYDCGAQGVFNYLAEIPDLRMLISVYG